MVNNIFTARNIALSTTLCFATVAFAQQKINIQGQIIDNSTGEPLIGATIATKASKSGGVTTDYNGQFSLETTEELPVTLKVSFVGYEDQEVDIYDDSEPVTITLTENRNLLDEIVVTGVSQGTSRKGLSFALSRVDTKALNTVPASDASTSLRGKVAGIRVDQSGGNQGATVYLRGAKSVSGNIEPLVVVDGFVTALSLSDIAPADIENIEVVKGAAASALYGTRGEGGVIHVITKKGKGNKLTINFDNEVGFSNAINIPSLSKYHHYQVNSDGSFKLVGGNRTEDYQANGFSVNLHPYATDYDNIDAVLSNQAYYTNNLAISGSGDKYNFYASYQNQSKGGITDAIDNDTRQSFMFNYGYQPNKRVKLELNSNYSVANTPSSIATSGSGGVIYAAMLLEPFVHLNQKDEKGHYMLQPDGMEYVGTTFTNPLYAYTTQEYDFQTTNFMLGGRLKYTISKYFNAEAAYSIENKDYTTERYYPVGYETLSKDPTVNNGSYARSVQKTYTRNGQAQLNYNQQVGDFNLGGALRAVYEYSKLDGFSASGYNLSAPVKSLDVTDASTRKTTTSWEKTVNYGFFLNLKADYKEKFFLDVLGRLDKSSRFGSNVGWAFFPRAAAAYRLTQDVDLGFVDELKLRVAYGQAGSLPAYGAKYSRVNISNSGGISFTQNANTDLKRAITSETEIGFDAVLWKKINVQFNYAFSNSKNDFISVPTFSSTDGSAKIYDNLGKVKSNSVELEVSSNIIDKRQFKWDLGFTFSRVRSEITSLGNVPEFTDGYWRRAEGLSTSAIWGFSIFRNLNQLEVNSDGYVINAGDGTRRLEDYTVNKLGFVVEKSKEGTAQESPVFYANAKTGNRKVIGDAQPDFTIGLSNTLQYRRFSLYFNLDWKHGGDKFNETNNYLTYVWRSPFCDETAKAGLPLNFTTAVFNQEQINDYWVESTSYLALREVSLSYDIPVKRSNLLKKYVKGARFSLLGRNLFILTNFKGVNVDAQTSDDFFN
ncbi:MAG: SusC/RagA family TonB-linked outer membrane protein, partial [Bacteroidales bacterium]|nr:SusC/RagA family TonB-linked outer membrane protein [Bacteroidales bacterium]